MTHPKSILSLVEENTNTSVVNYNTHTSEDKLSSSTNVPLNLGFMFEKIQFSKTAGSALLVVDASGVDPVTCGREEENTDTSLVNYNAHTSEDKLSSSRADSMVWSTNLQ